jgi:hypothetical protein
MSDEEYDEEIDEELEEWITGYYPKGGSYVVEDRYELVNDGNATLEIVYVNPELSGMPELDSASFTLIKSFELPNGELEKKIELKNVLINGQFKVVLPDSALRPTGYVGNTKLSRDAERYLFLASTFKLTDLFALPLPTVTIKGKFKHLESDRLYEITIDKAFLTQDLPGSFFRRPLEEASYDFIATDAVISPRPGGYQQ